MSDHIEHSCFYCGSTLHYDSDCPAGIKERAEKAAATATKAELEAAELRGAKWMFEQCKQQAPCPRDNVCSEAYMARDLRCPECPEWDLVTPEAVVAEARAKAAGKT